MFILVNKLKIYEFNIIQFNNINKLFIHIYIFSENFGKGYVREF